MRFTLFIALFTLNACSSVVHEASPEAIAGRYGLAGGSGGLVPTLIWITLYPNSTFKYDVFGDTGDEPPIKGKYSIADGNICLLTDKLTNCEKHWVLKRRSGQFILVSQTWAKHWNPFSKSSPWDIMAPANK